ncbi:MAG: formylglycine-generating enzyme family protein, partial [Victivallales bacterium]|nr:formylglycine-generating enzyme family protein [Victivallales bacterium]
MKKLLSMLFLFGILFAFTAKVHADGTYLVIDLETWQYRYTDTAPNLSDDTCRTTELWLRYIPEGTFIMGSPEDELGRWDDETQHKVTLTKPFYIGVFECTQRQWELVIKGYRPSYFRNDDYYATRPVEQVSYNMIRGKEAGAGWPDSDAVDATSFMGILREKTGLMFDLPTEAQWEYA